jgi:hypothetical protein
LEDERFIDISKDLIFFNHKKNITIEVHWKLFEKRFFLKNITFNDLAWKNIQFIKINNFTIPTFDKEYLIYYLIIHGSKHVWERIEWLYNIYLILLQDDSIDINKIIEYSKIMKNTTMLKVFFLLIERKFDYKINNDILELDLGIYKIADKIEKNWCILDERKGINLKEIKFIIMFQDSFLNKLKVIYTTVFQIKIYDLKFIKLHKNLTFLYYFIRPIRFLKNYFK